MVAPLAQDPLGPRPPTIRDLYHSPDKGNIAGHPGVFATAQSPWDRATPTTCPEEGSDLARRRKKYIEIEEVPGKPLRYWPHVLGGGLVAEGAVVDPQAYVHESAYIDPGARVSRGARVSSGAWVAEDAFVGEDAVVGTNSSVGRNARLGRGARLGMRVALGEGAMVADFVTVDTDERVPSGAAVLRDAMDRSAA